MGVRFCAHVGATQKIVRQVQRQTTALAIAPALDNVCCGIWPDVEGFSASSLEIGKTGLLVRLKAQQEFKVELSLLPRPNSFLKYSVRGMDLTFLLRA